MQTLIAKRTIKEPAVVAPPPAPSRLRRAAHACLHAAAFGLWCLNRLFYYLLPPMLHSGLRHLAPRICQRQEQQRFLRGLRKVVVPVPPPDSTPDLTLDDGDEPFAGTGRSLAYFEETVPSLELPSPSKFTPFDLRLAITVPPVDPTYLREGEEVLSRYRELFSWPEATPRDLDRKVTAYLEAAGKARVDRVRLLRELARLEQMRGKELLACTYRLRAMRLLGDDRHRDLLAVKQTLQKQGYPVEAAAAEALYGFVALRFPRCQQILQNALEYNRQPPAPVEFEFIEDRREDRPYKVAVIVSLYNAASKLPCFVRALQNQTLLRKNEVEFVFVDSHSPANEYEALRQTAQELALPYVFIRTQQRETIQTAWNRGILLARSPYLTFLGVDETIVPDALEILSGELDREPALDWVQGNSLVTEVDVDGVFVKDVMLYDRTGYTPDHVYLETCYLSWVGALYRRNIHDRFGYYDGTFGAAGDTEFKGRLLPFLKTKCIPQTLGVFLNYPEERTTCSPKAEIEDLRAWYLHRSLAGIDYALQRRDPADAEKLLLLALQYRKSYVRHLSTDLEYALNAAEYLADRVPGSPTLGLTGGINDLLEAYCSLEQINPLTARHFAETIQRARKTIEQVQKDHRQTPWLQHAHYAIANDNRHEQHNFFY